MEDCFEEIVRRSVLRSTGLFYRILAFPRLKLGYYLRKSSLGHNDNQECTVLLDCWSVWHSKDFRRDLVRGRWRWICLRYMPGSMTCLAKPCDVSIQQCLEVVNQTLTAAGHRRRGPFAYRDPSDLRPDSHIGKLCKCLVSWFVKAWQDINQY